MALSITKRGDNKSKLFLPNFFDFFTAKLSQDRFKLELRYYASLPVSIVNYKNSAVSGLPHFQFQGLTQEPILHHVEKLLHWLTVQLIDMPGGAELRHCCGAGQFLLASGFVLLQLILGYDCSLGAMLTRHCMRSIREMFPLALILRRLPEYQSAKGSILKSGKLFSTPLMICRPTARMLCCLPSLRVNVWAILEK